jgi:hypothetical protein
VATARTRYKPDSGSLEQMVSHSQGRLASTVDPESASPLGSRACPRANHLATVVARHFAARFVGTCCRFSSSVMVLIGPDNCQTSGSRLRFHQCHHARTAQARDSNRPRWQMAPDGREATAAAPGKAKALVHRSEGRFSARGIGLGLSWQVRATPRRQSPRVSQIRRTCRRPAPAIVEISDEKTPGCNCKSEH